MPIISDAQGTKEVSQEELDAYLALLPKVWSKEQHLAEINAMHKSEFDRKWLELEYDGRWEVVDAARDASNEYHEEAKALMAYWWNGWAAIKSYGETLTEQTMKTLIEIVGP